MIHTGHVCEHSKALPPRRGFLYVCVLRVDRPAPCEPVA